MKSSSVYDCTIIELDKHHHEKGNITVVENSTTIPFEVKRSYYLYDVPGGESRGGHAHRELSQLIVAASGSFSVTLDDGKVKRTFPASGVLWMIFLLVLYAWFWLLIFMMKVIIYVIINVF